MTLEEAARFAAPNRLYVEHGDAEFVGPNTYDGDALVVGLSWDLMPTEVRVIPETVPREWYEEPAPETFTVTDAEGNSYTIPLAGTAGALITLGGAYYALRRRKEEE